MSKRDRLKSTLNDHEATARACPKNHDLMTTTATRYMPAPNAGMYSQKSLVGITPSQAAWEGRPPRQYALAEESCHAVEGQGWRQPLGPLAAVTGARMRANLVAAHGLVMTKPCNSPREDRQAQCDRSLVL